MSDNLRKVKITDFGLSKLKSSMTKETDTKSNNADYQAPDCLEGKKRWPRLSDVFSMGLTLTGLYAERLFWNGTPGDGVVSQPIGDRF